MTAQLPAPTRTQQWLILATVVCYAIGYPLALLAHSVAGWLLVTVGGIPLIALGVVTVRRIHLSSPPDPGRADS